MRRDELTPDHVRRAVAVYMRHAWPDPAEAKPMFDPARLGRAATIGELFDLCSRTEESEGGPLCDRFTLRLGNARYPFMKFVVQEYLVDEEFFFSVDTHDDLDVKPDDPDYSGWQEVKRHNRDLKHEIEDAWAAEGLPTHRELQELAERLAELEREEGDRGLILVVDDEVEVARGLQSLLEARGYQVETAYDGRQVIERLGRDPLPDLVLLDYGMPELDGDEVLRRMRGDARTAELPVLMATASSIELERMAPVSGLLRKPYPRAVLFALLERLLAPRAAVREGRTTRRPRPA